MDEGGLQNRAKKKIRVKVYFNEKSFAEVAKDAEKAKKRRGGLLLFTQKTHGFSHEKVANTDGISKFLKFCWRYYRLNEADIAKRMAEAAKKKQEAEKELKRYGGV